MSAPDVVRFLLTVQYDGSAFHGWQVQPDRRSVQGVLEETLSRLAARPVTVLGAGRTDAGVHALGQVASVDMPATWSPHELTRALNAVLPGDLHIESVAVGHPDFHPRYDAVARTYTYDLGTHPESASPFHRRWCWALCEAVDQALLEEAAAYLPGRHSFAAFAKAGQPERGEECTVTAATWSGWFLGHRFTITADRYLHHMVRYLVGTMVDVARGRRPLSDVTALLRKEPGAVTSPPAPPDGLFLRHVEYPDHVLLGQTFAPRPSRRTASA